MDRVARHVRLDGRATCPVLREAARARAGKPHAEHCHVAVAQVSDRDGLCRALGVNSIHGANCRRSDGQRVCCFF